MMKTNSKSLAKLTEESLADLYLKAAEVGKVPVVHRDGYSWTKNPFVDWYSKVFNIRIPTRKMPGSLLELIREIKEGNAPRNVLLGPASRPTNLAEHLAANNFKMVYQQTGMAIDLKKVNFDYNEKADRVRRVDNEKELGAWLITANTAFGKERNPELYRRFLKEKDVVFYACYDEEKLVTTTMLHVKAAVAGIHLVGTLPEYRGKGYGTLTTKKALHDARKMGCEFGVLQASALGKKIYEKMGFEEYGGISHWEYVGKE